MNHPGFPRLTVEIATLLIGSLFVGCVDNSASKIDTGDPYGNIESAADVSGAAAEAAGRGPYDVLQFEETLMVEMRDGIRLATDVYRPSRDYEPVDERFPVLLHRTPYDKSSRGLVDQARWFTTHGYVVVVQDTRGLYASEGIFQKYHEFDAPDGYDTIEWITGLTYVEPSIGMWGTSYGAHTQADAAKLAPPGLATLVLTMGGLSDAWTHKVRNHGAFELGQQLGWAHLQLAAASDDPEIRLRIQQESPADWFPDTPFQKGDNPLSVAPNFEDYYLTMQNHGDYDDYFRGVGRNWAEYYNQTADIPMLHVGGWYDTYARGTIQNFVELNREKSSPMLLLMGPWTHGGNSRSYAGDIEFGEEAAIKDFSREFHLRWFDQQLRGQASNTVSLDNQQLDALDSPVTIFVMGLGDGHKDENGRLYHGGEWRTSNTWPLEGTEVVPFYLHGNGSLSRMQPSNSNDATTFTYDPEHPAPTIGGAFSGALKSGAYDQREKVFKSLRGGSENGFFGSEIDGRRTADRPDVLVFETEPLAESIEVIGPISIALWASSTAVDTDLTAKVVDVYPSSADYPEGFDLNITDGIIRARYRNSREHEEFMVPGTIYGFEIQLFPSANVFKAGHRIRLEISSSNYPRFDVNPNTGEPLGNHTGLITADNTIYHDATHLSRVLLPILPIER